MKSILTMGLTMGSFAIWLALAGAPAAQAAFSDTVTVQGEVGNMTSSLVVLKTTTGDLYLPRKAFNDAKLDPRPGKNIRVDVSLSEIIALNEKLQKQDGGKKNKQ